MEMYYYINTREQQLPLKADVHLQDVNITISALKKNPEIVIFSSISLQFPTTMSNDVIITSLLK